MKSYFNLVAWVFRKKEHHKVFILNYRTVHMKQNSKVMKALLDLIDSDVLVEYVMDNYYDEVKEAVRLENEL